MSVPPARSSSRARAASRSTSAEVEPAAAQRGRVLARCMATRPPAATAGVGPARCGCGGRPGRRAGGPGRPADDGAAGVVGAGDVAAPVAAAALLAEQRGGDEHGRDGVQVRRLPRGRGPAVAVPGRRVRGSPPRPASAAGSRRTPASRLVPAVSAARAPRDEPRGRGPAGDRRRRPAAGRQVGRAAARRAGGRRRAPRGGCSRRAGSRRGPRCARPRRRRTARRRLVRPVRSAATPPHA